MQGRRLRRFSGFPNPVAEEGPAIAECANPNEAMQLRAPVSSHLYSLSLDNSFSPACGALQLSWPQRSLPALDDVTFRWNREVSAPRLKAFAMRGAA